VEGLSPNLFRAHELGSAQDDACGGQLDHIRPRAPFLCQSKVHDHRPESIEGGRVRNQHYVFRLQVSMNDLEVVGMSQPMTHLDQQRDAISHRKGTSAGFMLTEW